MNGMSLISPHRAMSGLSRCRRLGTLGQCFAPFAVPWRPSWLKSFGTRYLLKRLPKAMRTFSKLETLALLGLFLEELIYGNLRIASDNEPFLNRAGFTFLALRLWLFRHLVLLSRRFSVGVGV